MKIYEYLLLCLLIFSEVCTATDNSVVAKVQPQSRRNRYLLEWFANFLVAFIIGQDNDRRYILVTVRTKPIAPWSS